jgi:hypothetical protein
MEIPKLPDQKWEFGAKTFFDLWVFRKSSQAFIAHDGMVEGLAIPFECDAGDGEGAILGVGPAGGKADHIINLEERLSEKGKFSDVEGSIGGFGEDFLGPLTQFRIINGAGENTGDDEANPFRTGIG